MHTVSKDASAPQKAVLVVDAQIPGAALGSVSVCSFVRVKRVKLVEISAAIPGAASVCVLVCASTAVVKQVQV